ncbi:MAG: hypothetical protein ACOYI8_07105 [Christensenellales bacterium]|jgi:hypothetical protein
MGKLEISIDDRTRKAEYVDASMMQESAGFLTCWDEEEGYDTIGYFISSGDMR